MSQKTKNASCYLIFAALSEILLDSYENTSLLRQYDVNLETKLKNLKANFERTSKHAHSLFTEEEQLSFFNMIRIFENLIEAAKSTTDFSELIGLIDAWGKKEITVINSKEDLLETAKQIQG